MNDHLAGPGGAVTLDAALRLRDGGHVAGEEWLPRLAELLDDGLLDPGFLLVRLTLTGAEGTELVVIDDFEPAVQNLCLRPPPVLAGGERYVYDYWAHEGGLDFSPDGAEITVTGVAPVEIETARFPLQPLLASLVGFARFAIDFMTAFGETSDDYDASAVDYFEDLYRDAAEAVGSPS